MEITTNTIKVNSTNRVNSIEIRLFEAMQNQIHQFSLTSLTILLCKAYFTPQRCSTCFFVKLLRFSSLLLLLLLANHILTVNTFAVRKTLLFVLSTGLSLLLYKVLVDCFQSLLIS
ncbi:hypothetical protein HD806DRAFT_406536 [Xylariaceae sp. AK1471]|nr:hypothetical protein HD806DRAFT_406536 [Xylariaceae sp. AK1471]